MESILYGANCVETASMEPSMKRFWLFESLVQICCSAVLCCVVGADVIVGMAEEKFKIV